MDIKEEQRRLLRSNDSSMTRALELAVIPVVFGAAGAWVDNRLGFFPRFTLVLGTLAVLGVFAKAWYVYKAQMDHEQALLAARIRPQGRPPAPAATNGDTEPTAAAAVSEDDSDRHNAEGAEAAPARQALVGEWS